MTKRELITEITHLNPTAAPAFLAEFDDADLAEYLQHLQWVGREDSSCRAGPAADSVSPAERVAAPAEAATADQPPPRSEPDAQQPAAVAADSVDQSPPPQADGSSQEESPTWLF